MALLKYSLLRLGTFAIVFAAGLLLQLGGILSAVAALVISWAVGYLFFNRLRLEAGQTLARRTKKPRSRSSAERADNAAEDALAEEFHSDSGTSSR